VEPLAIIPTMLALVSAVLGIFTALRNQKLASEKFELEQYQARNVHRASLIDDIEQVLNNVKEENGRLNHRLGEVEAVNRALARANDHLAARVDGLELENERLRAEMKEEKDKNARLTQRVEELEGELARLGHLRDNVP
jgi:chromosome segregation ATPase